MGEQFDSEAALQRLQGLLDSVRRGRTIAILPHNNPDPDAIAASVALDFLLKNHSSGSKKRAKDVTIMYKGVIGRAENHALVRYLDHPLQRLTVSEMRDASHRVLIDTQPGTGNNPLTNRADVAATAVIDHHPQREFDATGLFVDIRPEIGASCTILVEYLAAADLVPDTQLATALFYGIRTDTMGLQRGASPLDQWAFCWLLPHVDFEAIARIERAQVPPGYFRSIAETLQSVILYDNIIIANIGDMNYPDLTADMADFLLRMRGSRWVFCSGIYSDTIYFSLRTNNKRGAGRLAQAIVNGRGVAGGHDSMAGGQVPIQEEDGDALVEWLNQRLLESLEVAPDQVGETLI